MPNFPHGADARLIVARDLLSQIFPAASGQQLDLLLRSIDKDLTVPLRADASLTPDLTVHVGPAIVNNTVSGRQKSIPHINNVVPTFTSGTIVFPSTDGGTITVSPGTSLALSCPTGQYVKILVSLDSSGQLVLLNGVPAGSDAAAVIPAPPSNTLAAFYVSLFNNSGTISPISQSNIIQLTGGGGSGGAAQAGFAEEVSIPNGATSVNVPFSSSLPGVNYVALACFVNSTDTDPQFQPITITNKTTSGFTASWNSATDTANYKLAYIVPVAQLITGEIDVPMGNQTVTATLSMNQGGVNYAVVANIVDTAAEDPQYQPVTIVGKTNTTVTFAWNGATDSANYKVAYQLAVFQ